MNSKRNYQRELEQIIEGINENERPRLLLHSCCAPCSSYTLSYLSKYFQIILFYYNPNIFPESEYSKRVEEQRRFISEYPFSEKIKLIEGDYEPEKFFELAKGRENCPEGGERCFLCYELRLEKAFELAKSLGCDYVTTTLSISPHKNAEKINELGEELSIKYGVDFLPSDFKKKDGYRQSIELSKQYGLYRQDYCGCVYSKREREQYEKNH